MTHLSECLHNRFKKVPKYIWILLAIVLVGIFLRTYNFHDWLRFDLDQARDAVIVEQVVTGEKPWPLLGPTMRASGETGETLFRVGPLYYHLQILSAIIFGLRADSMAYPDVFFNILLIPLFFYFLRRYFSINVSLFLVGIYAISFPAIEYSRFAWNPNPIPFFVILVLLAMHEFLLKKEGTPWLWVGICGIALGIGIQLHVAVLLWFCLLSLGVAAYLLKTERRVWKKLLVVLALVMLTNVPQIVSEFQTGFANSRALFNSPTKDIQSGGRSLFLTAADDLSCHIEANTYLLSSLGQEECNFSYVKVWEKNKAGNAFRETVSWQIFSVILFFSLLGYFLLVYRFCTERDERKRYFLGLILVSSILFFVTMLFVIGSNFKEFRHFRSIFFVPYMFLGLIIEFLIQKQKKLYLFVAIALGIFVVGTNVYSLSTMATRLFDHKGNDGHVVFLGETENIVGYMKDITGHSKDIYFMSDKVYRGNLSLSVAYVAKKFRYNLFKTSDREKVPQGLPLFFIMQNHGNNFETEIEGMTVKNAKDFGEMRIYQLEY